MLDCAAILVRIRGRFPSPLAVVTASLSSRVKRLLGHIHLPFALLEIDVDDEDEDF